tara:strand:+ start:338 stop:523 length:186 start_codon:yes stop_codon:yes gene_type:complete
MNCPECGKELSNGQYVCTDTDYEVQDLDGNKIFTVYESHGIDGDEISSKHKVKYCSCKYYI